MKSRLEDLLATADRQLATRSYDAAIDNFRTALAEPGAADAGVQARLDAACRIRDEARGIAPPPLEEALPPAPIAVKPVVEVAAAPVPQPLAPAEQTAIEPPSFELLEDNPALRASRRDEYPYVEVQPISILNPTLPPETPGDKLVDALVSVFKFFS
jgi:hypothetical protein